MAEQTPDVEALYRAAWDAFYAHDGDDENATQQANILFGSTRLMDAVAARDRAAERRGAAKALREVRRLVVRCYPRSMVSTRTVIADLDEAIERADRIEAGS